MTKNEAAQAVGEPWHKFNKHLLDYRSKAEGKSIRYFIPFEQLTPQAQTNLSSRVEELPSDDVADIVEGILGDISHGSLEGARGIPLDLDSQLQAAQLEKTKVQTKALSEKLERHRQEIWNGWSQEFFECFSQAFAKLKNTLVSLQLDEEQLQTLNEALDSALSSMKDKLDFMYNDFMEKGLDDTIEEDDLLK